MASERQSPPAVVVCVPGALGEFCPACGARATSVAVKLGAPVDVALVCPEGHRLVPGGWRLADDDGAQQGRPRT